MCWIEVIIMRALNSSENHTTYPWNRSVEGSWRSLGQGEKGPELQKSEEKQGLVKGRDLWSPWTRSGQHWAEPLRGRGKPWTLPSHGFSDGYRDEEMTRHGYKNWGIFKHLYLTEKTDKPHSCQILTVGVASFVVSIKDKLKPFVEKTNGTAGRPLVDPVSRPGGKRFTGTQPLCSCCGCHGPQGLFLDLTSDASRGL